MLNQQLHTRTPTVVVHDNRGSTVREISYCRHPDTISQTDERITRHHYHACGYLERSIDARLYETQQSDSAIQPNIQQTLSLGGALSLSQGVDNGNNLNINDIEGTVAQQINAQGTVTTYEYSEPKFVRNLEKVKEGSAVKQLLKWASGDEISVDNNRVGKCIVHYDTAGKKEYQKFSLLGKPTAIERKFHFSNDIHWKEGSYDMNQVEHAESYKTRFTYDATGAVLEETDAKGHQRRITYDIAGFVKQSWLTLKGQSEQVILRSLSYSAAGQKLREEHGNGLVTTYEYEPETQHLLHVKTVRPQGHALGAKIMQDLRYEYDAVGNIICLKNDAEATRYWRNQKVVPENRYVYDSLYQVVSATGRESANQKTPASMQSQPVTALVKDAHSYTNYTRLYTYDRGGNLIQIRHNSPTAQQSFTQNICVSNKTNRALLGSQCSDPQKVDSYFDKSGNLTKLLNGDALLWNNRNELEATNKRIESGSLYEGETYQYDSKGQRATKLRGRKQGSSDKLEKVTTHYLSNIEVWEIGESPVKEKYSVVQVKAGTSANVRALCWEIGSPQGIENNSLRYSYDDGIGNSGLETDGKGQLVSYEEYYPYGGTAIWSSENAVEADYKTIRYSGKEKDSTGLYYYGYRYYQPWIGRWLSTDPAGTIDGLNLYRMVRNNPVTLHDPDGRAPTPTSEHFINRLPTSFHKIKTNNWVRGVINQAEVWNQEDSLDFKRETHYAVSKLGRHFSLYSTPDYPSKQLIVTAHGGFNLNSGAIPIPDGMTLEFLNPHRTYLLDMGIDNIAIEKSLTLFSISNHHLKLHNKFAIEEMELLGIRTVTGEYNNMNSKVAEDDNNEAINITNYRLTTYEKDTPDIISNALAANRAITQTIQDQTVRTDIVAVSDTITSDGYSFPSITTIGRLFHDLKQNNIKYDNIVCSFCRSKDDRPNMDYNPRLQIRE
ncbi:RHS repeat domain-containing protein [Proteus columbae]|uniref:RHS repeat domain-containing protein n=1 Tax=Proteus columbae TaxID=1987580 RepID=UPI000C1E9B6B|nr:RHS repeat-associated core domain-containing protein [Proteus columbae]